MCRLPLFRLCVSARLSLLFSWVDLSFRLHPSEIVRVIDGARKNKLAELGVLPRKEFVETFRQLEIRRFLGLRIRFVWGASAASPAPPRCRAC